MTKLRYVFVFLIGAVLLITMPASTATQIVPARGGSGGPAAIAAAFDAGGWGIPWPDYEPIGASPGMGTFINDASLSSTTRTRICLMAPAPKGGTLDGVEWYVGSVSSPSAVKVSFHNVAASGLPDGTIDQYRVKSSGITTGWVASGLMTSDGTDSGTKRTVSRGDMIATVWEWDSTQSGSMWIYGVSLNITRTAWITSPTYATATSGAAFSALAGAFEAGVLLKYADGTYARFGKDAAPYSSFSTLSYASNSTPDERGNRFTVSAEIRTSGAWWRGQLSGAADLVLYDEDDNVVATSTNAANTVYSAANTLMRVFWDDGPVSLRADQTYRLVVKPTTTTSVGLLRFDVATAGHLDAHAGGQAMHYTQRTDAGAWTDTTTGRAYLGLLVDGGLAQ